MAIVGHTANLSGGELALVRVLPSLLLGGVRVTVVLGEDGPLVAAVAATGAGVQVLPMRDEVKNRTRADTDSGKKAVKALLPTAAYIGGLSRHLRRLRVDVVHTNTLKAALYAGLAGRAARLPVLWHIRDRIAPDYLPSRTVSLVRAMSRRVPHRIAVNSRTTAVTLPPGVQHRLHLVPDCVEVPAAMHLVNGGEREAQDTFTFGMMGRLAPWKGQHVALEAFARACAEDSRLRLIFVGSAMFGEHVYEKTLRARALELGLDEKVSFRGFQADIWREYATFDGAIHASVLPEPFGQVVVEAMAAGLPVLASASGGPSEIIDDGINGILVSPGDDIALAQAMATVAWQPELRERLTAAGRETAKNFAPQATSEALTALYQMLVRGRR
ncbi:MAG TPA: glycosyltransferase family 4 protein [Propionibacteriaceae bacterium]|nr:glycosyltransferase family 4 protein [Propionibacteriaceae bacterium]